MSAFLKWREFFKDDHEAEETRGLVRSRDALSWMEMPYYSEFDRWLDEQSSAPHNTSMSHADLIASVTRANCFREIRQHLAKVKRESEAALHVEEP